jgi:DNA-binding response OmpR family regulator
VRILVVEDEPALREGIVDLLRGEGHEVEAVEDGLSAVERGADDGIDLILLDVMLPRLDGVEACRRIRMQRPAVPILMLTAKGSESDKVDGLAAGADDYVTKPFGIRELVARVGALARRAAVAPDDVDELSFADVDVDLGRCVVRRGDVETPLTAREVGVVRWLHRHRNRAVSRGELLEHVWGVRGDLQTRTVDMTVAKLRQKIEPDPGSPSVIRTVTGVGYIWGVEP